jgi:hypothetical protein
VQLAALSDYTMTLRDGLNLGGGDYYSFASDNAKVCLVHNDSDHEDVFVPEYVDATYSIYVYIGEESLLDFIAQRLAEAGLDTFVAEESA